MPGPRPDLHHHGPLRLCHRKPTNRPQRFWRMRSSAEGLMPLLPPPSEINLPPPVSRQRQVASLFFAFVLCCFIEHRSDVYNWKDDWHHFRLCGQQCDSRQQLMDSIWEGVIVTERTVNVNITRLRKKLGSYASNIVSRQGFGYVFEVEP